MHRAFAIPLAGALFVALLVPGCYSRSKQEARRASLARAPQPQRSAPPATSSSERRSPAPATGPSSGGGTARADGGFAPPAGPVRTRPARDEASLERDGYHVEMEDGRLWVFKEGSEALGSFLEVGEPAKSVTLVGAGPRGMTLRGAERSTLDSYMFALQHGRRGFAVFLEDGRVWVFREGSEALDEYLSSGEPAKSVTLVGLGPGGRTVRGFDRETIEAWLAR